jgi:hypothetical protein
VHERQEKFSSGKTASFIAPSYAAPPRLAAGSPSNRRIDPNAASLTTANF